MGYACPICQNPLEKQATGFRCEPCNIRFPNLNGLPFLWRDPEAARAEWRTRFNAALSDIEAQIDVLETAKSDLKGTQARLNFVKGKLQAHIGELTELLKDLDPGQPLARELHNAIGTQLPTHQGVLSYAPHIFRDWCWGDDENNLVATHLGEYLETVENLASVLVLGCGAGRLAYDLNQRLRATRPDLSIQALDSNPLLTFIGHRMASGDTLELTEFPLAPADAAQSAVTRQLRAPAQTRGLEFVCADALHPPFAEGTFDVILTPWLIDVIDCPPQDLMAVISRFLKPGGYWLNHGSVAFQGNQAVRMVAGELAELAVASGYRVLKTEDTHLPYLQSPASRQAREELVYTQWCQLETASTTHARGEIVPLWISDPGQAVPLSPQFQQQITTHRIHVFMMSLIDGKRSISDMARVLENERLMPYNDALIAIRNFLTTMHEEAVAGSGA